jgi:hypothetical protein
MQSNLVLNRQRARVQEKEKEANMMARQAVGGGEFIFS